MIAIINTEKTFYFSRNQIPFQIDCSDRTTAEGIKGDFGFVFTSAPADGGVLTISWNDGITDYEATLTWATVPDAEAYEVAAATGLTEADINNVLIPALEVHPLIAQFFTLTFQTDTFTGIRFLARKAGPMDMTFGATGFTISNLGTVSGADPDLKEDYLASAWVDVAPTAVAPETDYIRIGEYELYPDADDVATIDFQRVVDAYFTDTETPTAEVDATPVVCTALLRQIRVSVGQKYGDPVVRQKQVRSPLLRVHKGGITHRDWAGLTNPGDFISRRFLTLRDVREVDADQRDWLFWYFDINLAELYLALQAVIYYTDGTSATHYLWQDPDNNLERYQAYQMQAGFVESGVKDLADAAAKTCYRYDLRVVLYDVDTGVLSTFCAPVRFYIALPDYLALHFEYENTMGGIESWRMIGERALTGKTTAERYRSVLPALADANFQELLSYNEEDIPEITFNTGPMNRSTARALTDFLRARHKWLRRGDQRIPITIADSNYQADSVNLSADYSRNHSFKAILPPSLGVSNFNDLWT